ncbi:hypothetical protein Ngar_c03640 [Candidatus Nitrososphaera gargensis Ga9.2]|uniref:Uncharacterized protein n=1 Tax=Nitrososphaera gargensis (strain Ga9.2) TaxID=1237085 RepID=K0IHM6_NITGG|nr:hypothetical protein [Candidatus Nitrososphaera gargensis]AFU57281.1 hypothetical protein Ngar_c03330 [Candidatus Nitrososphaera gargensis Ga9.2]AFU57312.1 hypothetical protein Ngar_c03640 [Candidatus Nitrososphaera gargensis Ga9.2]
MAPKIISVELMLRSGRNVVNLLNGTVDNEEQKVLTTFKELGFRSGHDLNIDRIRSIYIFADADLHLSYQGAEVEFDMMSYYKIIRPLDIEEITIQIDNVFVPDQNRVIIVASDDPCFDYGVSSAVPHLFYSNSVTAIAASYTNLFFRHTIGKKNKFTIVNGGAANINLDIQHREVPESDNNGSWVSYAGFPKVLNAGDTYVFGDDAMLDTQHHFHRVRVQSTGANVTVKGEMLNI